jgi:anti-sigma factor RsiW
MSPQNGDAITTRGAPRSMSCGELVEVITDYLEGALSPEDRTRFEEHLDTCGPCRTYLEQMREVIRLTGKLGESSIPEPARTELLATFRNWRRSGT